MTVAQRRANYVGLIEAFNEAQRSAYSQHNSCKTLITELTADIDSLEGSAEGNYSLGCLERSFRLLDSLREKIFSVENPMMCLEQCRMTLDSTPLETSVESEANKQARSDGVVVFQRSFEDTKNTLVTLKARMTVISAQIEAHNVAL